MMIVTVTLKAQFTLFSHLILGYAGRLVMMVVTGGILVSFTFFFTLWFMRTRTRWFLGRPLLSLGVLNT